MFIITIKKYNKAYSSESSVMIVDLFECFLGFTLFLVPVSAQMWLFCSLYVYNKKLINNKETYSLKSSEMTVDLL